MAFDLVDEHCSKCFLTSLLLFFKIWCFQRSGSVVFPIFLLKSENKRNQLRCKINGVGNSSLI